jgi:hypothetical protein
MCVSVCQPTNGGNPFFITTVAKGAEPAPGAGITVADQDRFAATYSAVGSTNAAGTTAVCLYDFLLIAGARDATGVEADRYCGGALNPAPLGTAAVAAPLTLAVPGGGLRTSTQVCSKFENLCY